MRRVIRATVQALALLAGSAAARAAAAEGANTPPPAVPTDGLVLSYSFDRDGDGTVPDESGNRLNGTVHGARWVNAGVSGGAYAFDGVDDHIEVKDPSNLRAYSISVWVNLDDLEPRSVIARTSLAGPGSEWSHQIGVAHSNNVEHYIFPSAYPECRVTGADTLNTGVWYHVVGTGSDRDVMRLYVDGVEVGSVDLPGPLWRGGDRWLIGHEVGVDRDAYRGRRGAFHGTVDELRIYNRVLTEEEILRLCGEFGKRAATSAPNDLEAEVAALVEKLGAANPAARREARDRLNALGRKAWPTLRRHQNHADPEIRLSIRELLTP